MKNWVLIICFAILVKPVVPVVDYIINYDYIIAELCINKDAPELECNGKCYLMRKLANASDTETSAPKSKKSTHIEIVDLFPPKESVGDVVSADYLDSNSNTSAYSNLYSNPNSWTFFHPPIS